MAEEYSLVEVLMIQYQPGDKEYQDFLENEVHCFDGSWEDCSEEIQEVLEAKAQSEKNRLEAEAKGLHIWTSSMKAHEPDTLITEPLTAFKFNYVGQSFDRYYASGIEWEAHSMNAAYVFKNWLEELKKIGQSILADKKAMGSLKADKTIRFITLWTYSSWVDSYNQEFDSEWELIGLVDPKKIFSMLNADNIFKKPKGDLLAIYLIKRTRFNIKGNTKMTSNDESVVWKFPKQYQSLVEQASKETNCSISFPISGTDIIGDYIMVSPLEIKDYGRFWKRYGELKDANR